MIRTFILKPDNTEFIHVPLMMLLILHYSIHTVIRPQYWGSSIHSVIIVGHWYVTSLYLDLVNIYCTCYIFIYFIVQLHILLEDNDRETLK